MLQVMMVQLQDPNYNSPYLFLYISFNVVCENLLVHLLESFREFIYLFIRHIFVQKKIHIYNYKSKTKVTESAKGA